MVKPGGGRHSSIRRSLFGRHVRLFGVAAVALTCLALAAARAFAQEDATSITLQDALARARVANAHLPVSAFNSAIARAQLREARARLRPQFFFDGDVHQGAPLAYSGADARFQAVGVDTLFDGGRLRANVRLSEHLARGAEAGYRVTIKDVELDVRLAFTDGLRAQEEVAIRQAGLARLRGYLSLLEAQQAAGQGVAGGRSANTLTTGRRGSQLAQRARRTSARMSRRDKPEASKVGGAIIGILYH